MRVINPATDELIKEYQEISERQIAAKLELAEHTSRLWREKSMQERKTLLLKVANILRKKAPEFAEMMMLEMGKLPASGKAEAEKCAWVCDYYAQNSEKFLQNEIISTAAYESYVTFQPLGTILAVMPWNFPFWQVFRFAAPALMAGNIALLKHASNVPGCALKIENIFLEAGFPRGTFQTLLISNKKVKKVIEDPVVKAVTLTGSTPAGSSVAKIAGENLKKCVLELGGSDPYLVLKDADLQKTVNSCVTSRLINAGQSCIAAKRFIVEKSIITDFTELYYLEMAKQKMGDPVEKETTLGPLARKDLRSELHRQVSESVEKGANCILGGKIPSRKGAFYPPTILTNVKKGMPAYQEELFGPVATIISAEDEKEAIAIANDTNFGLGAAVFTRNLRKGKEIAEKKLQSGCCFVNDFVRSDPRLPFGGIKNSGFGRELSHFGIKEFVNIKTVSIEKQ